MNTASYPFDQFAERLNILERRNRRLTSMLVLLLVAGGLVLLGAAQKAERQSSESLVLRDSAGEPAWKSARMGGRPSSFSMIAANPSPRWEPARMRSCCVFLTKTVICKLESHSNKTVSPSLTTIATANCKEAEAPF